jgi:hypothetical protein
MIFDSFVKQIRKWSLPARIVTYYTAIAVLGASFYLTGLSRTGGVCFGLLAGAVISGLTYSFAPYAENWSSWKSVAIKSGHRLLLLVGFFALTYFFLLKEGQFIREDLSILDQISGLALIAFGVIFSGVVLGKGRFKPQTAELECGL